MFVSVYTYGKNIGACVPYLKKRFEWKVVKILHDGVYIKLSNQLNCTS